MTSRKFAALAGMLLVVSVAMSPQARVETDRVLCRALEVHTDDSLKVTVIVFHQRDDAQRSPLAALLRGHSGAMVEVQAADGTWRPARMLRLRSCFGRGLLVLSAPAPFPDRAEFALRLPAETQQPPTR